MTYYWVCEIIFAIRVLLSYAKYDTVGLITFHTKIAANYIALESKIYHMNTSSRPHFKALYKSHWPIQFGNDSPAAINHKGNLAKN